MTRFKVFPRPTLLFVLVAPLALARSARAGDLEIGAVVQPEPNRVEFEIGWRNSWYHERSHDAVWLLLRSSSKPQGAPLRLADGGHRVLAGEVEASFTVAEDRIGVFLAPAVAHRGDVHWRISLALDDARASAVEGAAYEAWGVEMVRVPAGAFALGDDHPGAVGQGAFFRRGSTGEPDGLWRVESEAAIDVCTAPGTLGYEVADVPQYRGDQQGPIPASWPKGTRAFFIMKYELRQGQYARFLDALVPEQRARRALVRASQEEVETHTIEVAGGRVRAAVPSRPCNFVSWGDTCAWMDWMALRPMTEFEYEKAARGPTRPCPLDFPWGTSGRPTHVRVVQRSRDLARSTVVDEASISHENLGAQGASYYWVMDLSGSLWERVITAGHPRGRAFLGSHGDGLLDAAGNATNADWPSADATGRDAPGIGYRGGADYFSAETNLTNPWSRVAIRTFATYTGAHRYKTYSARGVRTAPGE